MKKLFIIVFSIVLLVALSGCATIVSKSKYPVTISSTPSDAKVTIKDKNNVLVYEGQTPAVVNLEAGSGFFQKACYTITFSKSGYNDSIYSLTSSIDGWYWGNILIGGILGMVIIDPATGAMWKLDPNVMVEMDKQASCRNSLCIMDINKIPLAWKGHLIKIS
jgi:hypothetical protein